MTRTMKLSHIFVQSPASYLELRVTKSSGPPPGIFLSAPSFNYFPARGITALPSPSFHFTHFVCSSDFGQTSSFLPPFFSVSPIAKWLLSLLCPRLQVAKIPPPSPLSLSLLHSFRLLAAACWQPVRGEDGRGRCASDARRARLASPARHLARPSARMPDGAFNVLSFF